MDECEYEQHPAASQIPFVLNIVVMMFMTGL